jgi:hypothetical protein
MTSSNLEAALSRRSLIQIRIMVRRYDGSAKIMVRFVHHERQFLKRRNLYHPMTIIREFDACHVSATLIGR